jgi:hypothetical protein
MRLALILIFSQGLNEILKVAFHSPRPYWVSPNIEVQGAYGNFSIPSGHAQDAVCVWGLLAQRGGFRVDGSLIERLMRYFLGVALLVLIWYGLGEIRYDQASIIFYARSYLRALLAGAWVGGLAPLLFVRVGLAEAGNDFPDI